MKRVLAACLLLGMLIPIYAVLMPPASAHAQTLPAAAAQDQPTGSPANRNWSACADADQAKSGTLLGYIVPCITHTIQKATQDFSAALIEKLQPVLAAYITLTLVLFGVSVVSASSPDVYRQGFLLLIKLAFVVGLLGFMPQFTTTAYSTIESSQEIVASVIGTDGIKCDIANYQGPNTPLLWAQMDCLVGKLYGFTTGKAVNGVAQPNMLLAASAFGLLAGFFFGGTLGVSVFLLLIGVLWSILKLIIEVASSFLQGYLLVCLMIILSPLFLPLTLMRATARYFESWWKAILGGMLMPVIVASYTLFAMLMYDRLLFADDALIQTLFQYEKVKDALQQPRKPCSKIVTVRPDDYHQQANGALGAIMRDPFMQNFINPLLSGSNDLCAGLQVPTFKLGDVDSKEFKKEKDAFQKIFLDLLKLFVMAMLIEQGLSTVKNALITLVPSSAASAALTTAGKFESDVSQRLNAAKEGMYKAVLNDEGKDLSGAEFLKYKDRGVPGIFTGAVRGFITKNKGSGGE